MAAIPDVVAGRRELATCLQMRGQGRVWNKQIQSLGFRTRLVGFVVYGTSVQENLSIRYLDSYPGPAVRPWLSLHLSEAALSSFGKWTS